MQSSRKSLIFALAMIVGGILAFFLLLYLTGHDPDESPLTLIDWVIAGVLIGPGFGYLVRWRRAKDR
ncbi:ABC-type multidrug transport system permease subunit [Rhizobium sp. PvP014]|nr:ABC-type multidrug transport system permease subunit [Rhizobium sp. PvP014]MBP2527880.1 ABC-type multidrug transport system permease subunit [Rhizobium sp. PvP099]